MQQLCAGNLIATVCNYLICIHVRLCAAASLPYNQRKMLVQASRNHFITSSRNCIQLFIRHFVRPQFVVCNCSSLFQNAECMCDLTGHCLNAHTDQKVLVAAFCLCSPVLICRYLHFAHRIMFNAILHVHLSYFKNFRNHSWIATCRFEIRQLPSSVSLFVSGKKQINCRHSSSSAAEYTAAACPQNHLRTHCTCTAKMIGFQSAFFRFYLLYYNIFRLILQDRFANFI